jgi:hypothetical protein
VDINVAPMIGYILIATISPSLAVGAPAQLFGKTLNVSCSASAQVMGPNGSTVASRNVDLRIYISSVGRIFERVAQVAKTGATDSRDNVPGASGWLFVGQKLVRRVPTISGAYMQEISFDPGFGGCTFSGIAGHERGKAYKWRGLDGKEYQATGPLTFSGQRCSISAGNGL